MKLNALTFYGIALEHALDDEKTDILIEETTEHLRKYGEPACLVQIYPDGDFDENTTIITFVGVTEKNGALQELTLPGGEYRVFEQGEEEIDELYMKIYDELNTEEFETLSNFDFELWADTTTVNIPAFEFNINKPKKTYKTIEEVLKV
jgi:predicted transcriptional regulator YdeE